MSVGLGLRREMFLELDTVDTSIVDFWEVAPENWMTLGGKYSKQLSKFTKNHTLYCHGLSLSIGSTDPLDEAFIIKVKEFIERHHVKEYSEHLSYCSHQGHLYDLLPIPFTEEAMQHTIDRIKRVQDLLQRRLVLENASYYCAPDQAMSELDFTLGVIDGADCELLLDVNNVYVNSINHCYDPLEFIKAIPTKKIRYLHVAGHFQEEPDLLVDTHGAPVCNEVWSLLENVYRIHGVMPTLLERDFNIPPLEQLLDEVAKIKTIQNHYSDGINHD